MRIGRRAFAVPPGAQQFDKAGRGAMKAHDQVSVTSRSGLSRRVLELNVHYWCTASSDFFHPRNLPIVGVGANRIGKD
jgi:hypothetical protein